MAKILEVQSIDPTAKRSWFNEAEVISGELTDKMKLKHEVTLHRGTQTDLSLFLRLSIRPSCFYPFYKLCLRFVSNTAGVQLAILMNQLLHPERRYCGQLPHCGGLVRGRQCGTFEDR